MHADRQKILVAIVLTLLAVTLVFWSRLYAKRQPPTGDEPHYLLMAKSLVDDRDLDLRADYQRPLTWPLAYDGLHTALCYANGS